MEMHAHAVYENGVLRPTTLLKGLTEGQEVQVTVRALLTNPEEEKRREAAFLRYMDAQGFLAHFPPPKESKPKDFKPLIIEGEPLSEQIIRERR